MHITHQNSLDDPNILFVVQEHALANISHHHLYHPALFGQIMEVSHRHNSTKQ